MLKRVRKIPFVNRIVRDLLIKVPFTFIEKKVLPRWRLSGKIPLKVGQISFEMLSECDDFLVDTLFYDSIDEKAELIVFSEFAKHSRMVLDVGANTGLFSIVASKVNHQAEIFAFEPYSVNAVRLKNNLELNSIGNVHVKEEAIGAVDGKLMLSVPSDKRICQVSSLNKEFSKMFFSKDVVYEEVVVECRTIDAMFNAEGVSFLDLIKLDVESYEVEAFKGGLHTIREKRPVILCEIFVDEEREMFFNDFLKEFNYYLFLVTPIGLVRLDQMQKAEFRNFLFSPESSKQRFIPLNSISQLAEEFAETI